MAVRLSREFLFRSDFQLVAELLRLVRYLGLILVDGLGHKELVVCFGQSQPRRVESSADHPQRELMVLWRLGLCFILFHFIPVHSFFGQSLLQLLLPLANRLLIGLCLPFLPNIAEHLVVFLLVVLVQNALIHILTRSLKLLNFGAITTLRE